MSTSILSTPLELAPGLTLRSRMIVASLTRNRAGSDVEGEYDGSQADAVPNKYMVEYYRMRARGGFGLIMTEGTLIEPQGTEWPTAPGIWTDAQVAGWKQVIDAVHEEGGAIFCQLWHLGRLAHPDQKMQLVSGLPIRAPSNVSARGGRFRQLPGQPGYVGAPAMDDPKVAVELFRVAAENAKKAGFDGVELHSANGYLPSQFLDKFSNLRTDAYGGSAENRVRFTVEALEAILTTWDASRVGIKLSPYGGYNDVGMDAADTVETFSLLLSNISRLALGHVQFTRYSPFTDPVLKEPGVNEGKSRSLCPELDIEQALARPFVEGQRKEGRDRVTKLFWNGGFGGLAEGGEKAGEEWLASGKGDAIAYGTDSISTPDLPFRFFHTPFPIAVDKPRGGSFFTFYNGTADKGKFDGYLTYGFCDEFVKEKGEGNARARME